jgi:hypothetical protein
MTRIDARLVEYPELSPIDPPPPRAQRQDIEQLQAGYGESQNMIL